MILSPSERSAVAAAGGAQGQVVNVNEGRRELWGHVEDFALRLQIVIEDLPTATETALPGWRNGDCRYFSLFFSINETLIVVVGQCLRPVAVILPSEWHGAGMGDLSQGG